MTVARRKAGTETGLQIRSEATTQFKETESMTVRAVALAGIVALAAIPAACSRGAQGPASNANTASAAPEPTTPSDPTAPQEVNFTTEDGVMITGDLYLPAKSPAPAVLALHQWDSDRAAYRDFAKAMREAGFVVLAIDGRGFGG